MTWSGKTDLPEFGFSNFEPCTIVLGDCFAYPTVEHAYQALKTMDPDKRRQIREAATPGKAKRLGRRLVLRPNWTDLKIGLMKTLLQQKFRRPNFLQRLLDTGDTEIVEWNNWHDNFWGHCVCEKCDGKEHQNWLGRLLMEIRSEVQASIKL